jgi:hypothetical protein
MNNGHDREQENRVEQLINLVEKHTRTERHLEQHSDISDPENLEHAEKIQREREDEIDNLKNIIAYDEHEKSSEIDNLERNINYTGGYLSHNADHMEEKTLRRTQEKQEHRKDQLDSLT